MALAVLTVSLTAPWSLMGDVRPAVFQFILAGGLCKSLRPAVKVGTPGRGPVILTLGFMRMVFSNCAADMPLNLLRESQKGDAGLALTCAIFLRLALKLASVAGMAGACDCVSAGDQ